MIRCVVLGWDDSSVKVCDGSGLGEEQGRSRATEDEKSV